jgi:hypothetical protein
VPAAELVLPERHVLFGRGATDHRQSVHRLPGWELLCVEHALNQGHTSRHDLRDPADGSVLSWYLLRTAGNSDRRPRVLPLRVGHLLPDR